MTKHPTPEELAKHVAKIRALSNGARFDEAYALSMKMMALYPNEVQFAYQAAVFSAEDDTGFTPQQVRRRHASAATKLKKLLPRLRGVTPRLRLSMRNEYYWFSHQPRKQYLLGVETGYFYPQGVGAEQLARMYALKGKRTLALRWAKRSEKAWLKFFKQTPRWYNSYFFYAAALGYQGRRKEMEKALQKAACIAGKPFGWQAIRDQRRQIEAVVDRLDRS